MKNFTLAILLALFMTPFFSFAQLFGPKKSISTSTGNLPSVIDSGNLDNDTKIDIIIGTTLGNTIEWYKNNGNGTFTLQTLVTNNLSGVLGLTIADIDNDSHNDIVASAYFGAKVVWFKNNGNGTFGSEQVIASGIGEAGAVKVGYIDNNTTKDVVVASGTAGQVLWFSNDGNGNFLGGANLIGSNGTLPRSIDLADFNGDGDMDVVVGYINSRNVELYENQLSQNGSVSFLRDPNGSISSGSSNINEVSFGDVDNDNNLDIIKVNKNGLASWYKKESNGTFSEHALSTSYSKPATARVADFDDDSTNDIIVGYANNSSSTDALTWYDNSAPEALIDITQDDINQVTINDFDGDGDLDVASISQAENALNWFENLTYSSSLAINDFEYNNISIYPNPVKDVLYFKGNISEDVRVLIYSVIGKRVMETSLNISNPKIDVSKLNKGLYLIKFKNYNTNLKFVKR